MKINGARNDRFLSRILADRMSDATLSRLGDSSELTLPDLGRGRPAIRCDRIASQSCFARGPARTPVRAFATVLLTLSQLLREWGFADHITPLTTTPCVVERPKGVQRMRCTGVQGCTHWACAQQGLRSAMP
jgi:hypothetical protein